MVFPVIQFLSPMPTEDDDLTKYILQAEFDGRLKWDEGFLNTTGNLCTLTAATNKDLYLTAAKVVFFSTDTINGTAVKDEVVLKVNDTIVETVKQSYAGAGGDGGIASIDYEFKNIGHKVDATEVLKLQVIKLDAETEVEGFIQAIEVPDNQNPVTYTGT